MSSIAANTPRAPSEPTVLKVERGDFGVVVTLLVPTDLCYFEGHFPGCALLPGVVQTKWAVEFARREFPNYFQLRSRFTHLANIKFMRVIVPGKTITLTLRDLSERGEIAFEYHANEFLCSSGQLGFAAT